MSGNPDYLMFAECIYITSTVISLACLTLQLILSRFLATLITIALFFIQRNITQEICPACTFIFLAIQAWIWILRQVYGANDISVPLAK